MQPTHHSLDALRAIASAFPTRPMRIRRTGVSWLLMTVMGVSFLVGATVMAHTSFASLKPDWQLRQRGVYIPGDIDGGCKRTMRGLLLECSATLRYSVDERRYEVVSEFTTVGWIDDYSARIVRSSTDPAMAALDMALDRWWTRFWTALVGFLFCGVFAVGSLYFAWQTFRMKLAYRGDIGPLQPTLVEITGGKRLNRDRHELSYRPTAPSPGRVIQTVFTRKEQLPLMLEDSYALAVVAPGTERFPVLLDAGLSRLALREEERARLLAVMDA